MFTRKFGKKKSEKNWPRSKMIEKKYDEFNRQSIVWEMVHIQQDHSAVGTHTPHMQSFYKSVGQPSRKVVKVFE